MLFGMELNSGLFFFATGNFGSTIGPAVSGASPSFDRGEGPVVAVLSRNTQERLSLGFGPAKQSLFVTSIYHTTTK